MDLTGCATSSYLTVIPSLEINLENNWDFLYFQYSTNNGTSWITLGTYTGAMGVINPNYIIPNNANRFRFVFTSDATVNSYGNGANTFIYYADILGFSVICPTFLPVELLSFTGSKGNVLTWVIESENDCDYYTVERSVNGTEWTEIAQANAVNANSYSVKDYDYQNVINYYRLSQTDLDGTKVTYQDYIVSIDNRVKDMKVISVTNILGQTVSEDSPGLIIITLENGEQIKKVN